MASWSSGVMVSVAAAAVTGFLSLKLLLYLVREGRLYLFSCYLVPLGLYGLFFR